VAVELRILHVRRAAAHVHRLQLQALGDEFRLRQLELGNDDDGRRADGDARVLVGRALHAARHHQPHVHAVGAAITNSVGLERVVQRLGQTGAVQPDVHRQCHGSFAQALQVRVEEGRVALHDAQPLPDTVPQHETTVEDRHHGVGARLQFAVDPDADRCVARVVVEIVDAL